jgi:hypothetical protein
MSPLQTIVLAALANLIAIPALAVAVHLRLLPVDVALWIAMFVVFMSSLVVRPALQALRNERSKSR